MQHESRRFALLVCGKALAFFMILTSLSDRLSTVIGFDYMNSLSFLICGIAAVAFFALIRFMGSHKARLVFACFDLGLIVIWCALLAYLKWFAPEAAAPSQLIMFLYTTVGRIVTLFINMQWNFHYSLNNVGESAKSTVVAVLLAYALFLMSTIVGSDVAVILVIAAILASSVLGFVMERVMNRNPQLPNSIESIEKLDARSAISSESYPRTRVLYFGARIAYGIAFGLVVGLVSMYDPVESAFPAITVMALLILGLGIAGVWLFSANGGGSLYVVVATPLFLALISGICFFSLDLANMVSMSAMLVETVWMIQNLFQLPSYRRMTGMRTSVFSYYEYSAQIIPFYFVVWVASSGFGQVGAKADTLVPGIVGAVSLAVLMGLSVAAMIWHIVRYYPNRLRRSNESDDFDFEGSALAGVPKANLLTPREREVFGLLAEGYSRPYIAKTLFISVDTVKVHAKHIYAKLGYESQDELIRSARDGIGADR